MAVTGALVVLTAVNDGIFPLPLAAKPIEVLSFAQLKKVEPTAPVKLIAPVAAPLQTNWSSGFTTVGIGFTVMVKYRIGPGQPFATGVTVMKPDCGIMPLLTGIKEGISPVPLAGRPMEGLLFVQLKLVPATAPVKLTAVVAVPGQNVWFAGCTTSGVGFTLIVNVLTMPWQGPPLVGVTVMVAVMGVLPVLTAAKKGISPEPLAGKPMDGLLLVQLKVVPLNVSINVTGLVVVPLHTTWFTGGTVMSGEGFTVILNESGVPVQVR